jgi:hypothetical protein
MYARVAGARGMSAATLSQRESPVTSADGLRAVQLAKPNG